jgi:hypothetical protein
VHQPVAIVTITQPTRATGMQACACLGVLVQLPVDVQHEYGVKVQDGGLQQRVQLNTRGGKMIVHAGNVTCTQPLNTAVIVRQTTANYSPRRPQIGGRPSRRCTAAQRVTHDVLCKRDNDAHSRRATVAWDLVVALVQVAILAHHEQGRHGAGNDGKVAAGCCRVSVVVVSSAKCTT